ncbi:hypothetical protein Lal_00028186 [Lupinus albus]|nr:hypothetical protein Lal_00028186 [Lupinus albus]
MVSHILKIDPHTQNKLERKKKNLTPSLKRESHSVNSPKLSFLAQARQLSLRRESSSEQYKIFHTIREVVNRQQGHMFFLYGYGGTGKTHMWQTLTYALRSEKHIVLIVASSGIASLLLPGGRKAHSKFKIRVPSFDNSVCNIHQGTELAELLKQTKLIIWDEAPMTHKYCFEALDKSLGDIVGTTNDLVQFGGKVIVFGGDFRQILPVVPRGCRSDIMHATINASYLWHQCTVLTLTNNMRLKNHNNASDIKEFSD